MGVTIILPTKDNDKQLTHCLKTLFKSTSYPFKLVIIDVNTNKDNLEYKKLLKDILPNRIKIIEKSPTEIKTNIQAINFGLREALENGDDALLIHDDMNFFKLYKRDWLEELYEISKKTRHGMLTYKDNIKMSGKEYLDGMSWIGSWFCYIPNHILKTVGLIDENFTIGEDIDYAYRVRRAGYMLGEVDFWFEHHQVRDNPHNDQSEQIKRRNEKYFRDKHGL